MTDRDQVWAQRKVAALVRKLAALLARGIAL